MNWMLATLIVCLGPGPALAPTIVVLSGQRGTVVYYGPGTMERVGRNRTNPDHRAYDPDLVIRKDVAGYISRSECSTIGRVYRASVNGGPVRLYQQLDCSNPTKRYQWLTNAKGKRIKRVWGSDQQRHQCRGPWAGRGCVPLVMEIDWLSAVREGISRSGRGRATVYRTTQ